MAAILWSGVLAFEWLVGISVALAAVALGNLGGWLAVPIAIGTTLLTQYLLVIASYMASHARCGPEAPWNIRRSIRVAAYEAVHFGLAMLAMSLEPIAVKLRRSPQTDGSPVLLLHGLACNQGVWMWLRSRLRAAGLECIYTMNLQPVRADIDHHAQLIERKATSLHRLHGGARVIIVAHSMGGLAARAMLQHISSNVVEKMVTLGTPHRGTALACALHWPCGRQMCPESDWLAALNAPQALPGRIPITSIYSPDDNFVVPANTALLPGARIRAVDGLGHFGLLIARKALDVVLSELKDDT